MKKKAREKSKKITAETELALSSQLTVLGNHEAVIEGCRDIEEYDEGKIKFSLGNLSISFCGKDLMIKNFGDGSAVICGEIADISFC